MKITVVGIGYVGLANAVALARYNQVTMLDIDAEKVQQVSHFRSPISDTEIESFFSSKKLSLNATTDPKQAFNAAEIVIVATPTDFNPETNEFDTSSVSSVIEQALRFGDSPYIVIRSTIPIGCTHDLRTAFKYEDIGFSPEFLREGSALSDCLNPTRIILSNESDKSRIYIERMLEAVSIKSSSVLLMPSKEAEAIKLFSNSFLAMRVAYFNEVDTFAMHNSLDSRSIIHGISLDPRIGDHYNNPSFGYGGYCLPKDTKQLLANYRNTPQTLIRAIVESNAVRKEYIALDILSKGSSVIGFYKLTMKSGSDNIRSSSIQDILRAVMAKGVEALIYEPILNGDEFFGAELVNDLAEFKERCDLIVVNRCTNDLSDVSNKLYSRDLTGMD